MSTSPSRETRLSSRVTQTAQQKARIWDRLFLGVVADDQDGVLPFAVRVLVQGGPVWDLRRAVFRKPPQGTAEPMKLPW